MVYITGRTFTHRLTNSVIAKVYANCDSVELFLNETSQGARTSDNRIFTWPVKLSGETNIVRAIGKKSGVHVSDSLVWVQTTSKHIGQIGPATSGGIQDEAKNRLSPNPTITD